MLEDAVIVNIDSIRDNDRLNVVVASSIIGDNPKPPKPSYAPLVPQGQVTEGSIYNGTPLLPRLSLQPETGLIMVGTKRLNPESP